MDHSLVEWEETILKVALKAGLDNGLSAAEKAVSTAGFGEVIKMSNPLNWSIGLDEAHTLYPLLVSSAQSSRDHNILHNT